MAELRLADKQAYARVICLFLAEGLRHKTIDLSRAKQMAKQMVANINLLDTEQDFLKLIKELSKDFSELVPLQQQVASYIQIDNRQRLESLVQEYVLANFAKDSQEALSIMHDALAGQMTLVELSQHYPKFKNYLATKHVAY